jgi:hypothetical protein
MGCDKKRGSNQEIRHANKYDLVEVMRPHFKRTTHPEILYEVVVA